jgi:predicted ATPase/class 3 adenylate cyclase
VGADPERVPPDLPVGTVTFLFTDIEGSTRLLQALGDRYAGVLALHGHVMRGAITEHHGAGIRTEGDSFFAVFSSVHAAIQAAVAAQRGLASADWPADVTLRVRMGLHTGEGRLGDEDYVGLDVHRAARIAAAAHGGEILVSDATRTLVADSLPRGVALRDLGAHRLKDLEKPEELHRLIIDGLPAEFPPPRSVEIGKAHLPGRVTSFIGRGAELDALRQLVHGHRLVTLIGPGGTGKTRLALELAAQAAADYADGAWFVDLSPLTDPTLVGPTIARALGLSDQPQWPIVDQLKAHVEHRELLLVLDNFEHVLPASPLVGELLGTGPRLSIVATSRAALNLYGEQGFPVAPLALPEPGTADVAGLAGYEAIALFVERARAVKPAFAITGDTGPAVAGICIRLDGLPLAIELAASRIRLLEPREILARLDRHLPTLASGGSNLPTRQRTLQATIDWSYDLLPTPERTLFARLAIFAGGASLDAAESICNPDGELGLDTFDGVAMLVDQSLLRRTGDGADSRFGMLETIRAYGRDRLAASGGLDEVAVRHLDFYRDVAELVEPELVGPDQAVFLDRLEREHDNLREALRRALELRHAASGLRLAAALWRFWFQRGYLREGRTWLESLLAVEPTSASRERARAYGALGGLAYWLSDADATDRAYATALQLYRQAGDVEGESEALYDSAFGPVMHGEMDEARRRFEASLALAGRVGRADIVAKSKQALGMMAMQDADPARAVRLLEEALAFYRQHDEHFHLGDALTGIAQAYVALDRPESARAAYVEALGLFVAARNLPSIATAFSGLADLESSAGRHTEAMRLVGAAAALKDRTGASGPLVSARERTTVDAARAAIGAGSAHDAHAAGRRMTLEEAIGYAAALAGESA